MPCAKATAVVEFFSRSVMIVIGGVMTRHARATAGQSKRRVFPIGRTRLLCVAGVVGALLGDPARTVIAEVSGVAARRESRLGYHYALGYGLGFLIFGPLSDRDGEKLILAPGMAVLLLSRRSGCSPIVPIPAGLRTVQGLVAASFSSCAGLHWRGATAALAVNRIGATSTAFLSAGSWVRRCGSSRRCPRPPLGLWPGGAGVRARRDCHRNDLDRATLQRRSDQPREKSRPTTMAVRPSSHSNGASFPVPLSFVAMYAALGPLLQASSDLTT